MTESPYLLDNRRDEAADRFTALAALYDPMTIGHLDTIGIGEGSRCLEIGAGGGSMVRHLSERVGPTGRVLATDVEPRFLEPLRELTNVDVARHDVVADPLPEGEFDLVHARLVLIHIPERLAVLRRLVAALRPGGWLLLEDADGRSAREAFLDPADDDERLANRLRAGLIAFFEEGGLDFSFGRSLLRLLREHGLVGVAGDAYLPFSPAVRTLDRSNFLQLREQLIERGLVTEEDLQRYLARLDDAEFPLAGIPMVSAWGRRPEA
jgi:SAM-dependent methyltransferase